MKYDEIMIRTAKMWSEMSSCKRGKVGAILAKDNRIVSIGYNGTHPGSNNKCERTYVVCEECGSENISVIDSESMYCKECKKIVGYRVRHKTDHSKVIHAEMNALLFAGKYGIPTAGSTLYVTTSPCAECAKHIVQAGVERVVYLEDYKDNTGIRILKENNVRVDKCLLDG